MLHSQVDSRPSHSINRRASFYQQTWVILPTDVETTIIMYVAVIKITKSIRWPYPMSTSLLLFLALIDRILATPSMLTFYIVCDAATV